MLIITLRTDKPEAELGLYQDDKQVACSTWEAHRKLAETIHVKIRQLLENEDVDLHSLAGIVIYKGPGSFTGLRIGFSVANALSSSLAIPIVSASDPRWIEQGITSLMEGNNEIISMPEYGAEPRTTQAKK